MVKDENGNKTFNYLKLLSELQSSDSKNVEVTNLVTSPTPPPPPLYWTHRPLTKESDEV